MATGVFNTARGHGQLLQHKRRVERQRGIDRFAEALSKHDAEAGNPGGSVPEVSAQLGLSPVEGNEMLQRIKRALGPQAR